MHDLPAPKTNLSKKDKPWDKKAECQEAFEKIKKTLTSELFLTHYNPDMEIIGASDGSSYGVGACILHKMTDWIFKPIAYASRALLSVGKNYSQIEKKGSLDYIRCLKVPPLYLRATLYPTNRPQATTNHFWLKGLPTNTGNRLQRSGTILLNYNFKMVKLPSKKFGYVDRLSRIIFFQKDQETTDVFSICDEVLLYRERAVIPSTLQKHILKDFHAGHPGSSRMKSLKRIYVHWPNEDIEIAVKSCKGCDLAIQSMAIQSIAKNVFTMV